MKQTKRISFGGGCFWCSEAVFLLLDGVESVKPGYAGGTLANPTYEEVTTGKTGHAEVVEVEYDPEKISLDKLLEVFFAAHDPTTRNRQGADVGTQYRSIILFTDRKQKPVIDEYIMKIADDYDKSLTTEVEELMKFYPAEEYHQRYYERNPGVPYSKNVIEPKVEKIKNSIKKEPAI